MEDLAAKKQSFNVMLEELIAKATKSGEQSYFSDEKYAAKLEIAKRMHQVKSFNRTKQLLFPFQRKFRIH